ncbi:hypothetical protein J6590_025070 [Homalodisca vitripennis]|nr:hypothetical protein J6590_025070 [Homalodisca vitripennis]
MCYIVCEERKARGEWPVMTTRRPQGSVLGPLLFLIVQLHRPRFLLFCNHVTVTLTFVGSRSCSSCCSRDPRDPGLDKI